MRSPEQALRHPYFAELHDADDEPSHSDPESVMDIEQRELEWPIVKELLRKEAERYKWRTDTGTSVDEGPAGSATHPASAGAPADEVCPAQPSTKRALGPEAECPPAGVPRSQ